MDNETAAEFALMRAQIEQLQARVVELESFPEQLLQAFDDGLRDAPPMIPESTGLPE